VISRENATQGSATTTNYNNAPPPTAERAIGQIQSGQVSGYRTQPTTNDPPVWTGRTQVVQGSSGHPLLDQVFGMNPPATQGIVGSPIDPITMQHTASILSTRSEQLGAFYQMDDMDLQKLRQLALAAGYDGDYASLRSFWGDSVDMAAEAYTLGGEEVTPWDVAAALAKDAEAVQDTDGDGIPDNLEKQTQVSRSTDLTDPETAEQTVRATFQDLLGRDPTDQEVQAFTEALRRYERTNPSVTRTTMTPTEGGELTTQETVSRGGATDPGTFAQGYVMDEMGGEEQQYRVATKYASVIDALFGAEPAVHGEIESA
jgi:hypothetical protein